MKLPAKIRFFRVNTVFKDDQLFKIWFQNRLELADTQRELNKTNIEQDLFYFRILVLRKSQIEARMEQFRQLFKINYPPRRTT